MCGIVGYVSKSPIKHDAFSAMIASLGHRGPDDSGCQIFHDFGSEIGLGHRRLSILDISMKGHQPMRLGIRYTIVYNGEIYNFIDLKNELKGYGYSFTTNTDTEVVLAAYDKWAEECVNKINGMFAIAIYDKLNGKIFLARDRIGKKPLYYFHSNSIFLFASELKPIMLFSGFQKRINTSILPSYLHHQYISGQQTVFESVFRVEPGSYLVYDIKEDSISKYQYWDLIQRYFSNQNLCPKNYDDAINELNLLLRDSVQKRLISDVPIGCFLSGGIDSSLISAIAQSLSSQPIRTFSIGFEDNAYDESGYAKDVADYLGTNHTNLRISENDMFQLVDSIPQYFDEPFADPSQIPTMLVSELAKSQITVALSGDGGDELFCGYQIYKNLAYLDNIEPFVNSFRSLTFGLDKFTGKLSPKLRAIFLNSDIRTKTQLHYFMGDDLAARLVIGEKQSPLFQIEDRFALNNWQTRRMLLDMLTYLPDDILVKVDRASMKYGLEARAPLLDYRILELSFRMQHDFKYRNGQLKYILKDLAYQYVPRILLDRPKHGFGVPINKWLSSSVISEQFNDYCAKDFVISQNIFDTDVVEELQKQVNKGNTSSIGWAYFVFQQWYSHYFLEKRFGDKL